jgi:hypothetical protein
MKLSLMNLFLADTLTGNAWPMAQTGIVGEDQTFGAWTKDGRYFMFSAGSPEIHDLWAVEGPERARQPDRIPPLRITNGPMNWVEPISGNTTGEIYALGESRRRELVSLKPGTDSWRPYLNGIPGYELDFSRDGERVAYIHYPDHRLWIARVDGTERIEMAWPSFEAHRFYGKTARQMAGDDCGCRHGSRGGACSGRRRSGCTHMDSRRPFGFRRLAHRRPATSYETAPARLGAAASRCSTSF